MQFDDRLDTVLRQPIRGEAFARTQYRQLLDILGAISPATSGPQVDLAYRRLDELSATLPASAREALIRKPPARLRNPRLALVLAGGEPAVASAAVNATRLSEAEWLTLIPELPVRARGFLRNRRDLGPRVERSLAELGIRDRGLPPAARDEPDIPQQEEEDDTLELVDAIPEDGPPPQEFLASQTTSGTDNAGIETTSDIARLLKRIEEFNQARRKTAVTGTEAPRLPLGDHADESAARRIAPFDFATDTEGRIAWADPQVAPMIVGMRLSGVSDEAGGPAAKRISDAVRRRQPLRNLTVQVEGAPAVAGDWQVDATPRFDRAMGGFAGYAGRFRRAGPGDMTPGKADTPPSESDRLREILHELKTPAGAIQGFAEVIQQGLLGPLLNEYRAIAAMIASDIAYVLAGFDEIERLAKIEGGAIELQQGDTEMSAVVRRIVAQLEAYTAARGSGFDLGEDTAGVRVGLDESEIEQLVWRLLAVLAGEAAPSEKLAISCKPEAEQAMLRAQLPAKLAARDDEALFGAGGERDTASRSLSTGMFGSGFSLRLARAEATAAGGALKRDGNYLSLTLPAFTQPAAGPPLA